jgi:chemotaxis protein MotB
MFKKDCLSREANLDAARTQLSQNLQQLENDEHEIRRLKESHNRCMQQLNRLRSENKLFTEGQDGTGKPLEGQNLQNRYQELEKVNASLSGKITNLKIEIKKRDSIIQLQEDVIRLLDDTKKTIETSLKEQISKKLFEIETMENRLRMVIKDTILFNPGSMMINANGKKILRKIAISIKENQDQHIRVEGHTDNTPAKKIDSTNWELSATRAIAVVRFLEEAGLDSSKLSAVAYGASRPVASNDTEAGRLQNRRIEMVLYYPK